MGYKNHRYLIKKNLEHGGFYIPFFPLKTPTIFHPSNQKMSRGAARPASTSRC